MHQCSRRISCVLGVLAAVTLVVGCVANTPPKQEVRAPADLRPDLLMIAVYPLIDDDNNGYPDTIPLVVYLWDERYPLPLWADGSIHFTLTGSDELVIAEWDVAADVVISSRRRDQVGAAHHMTLDIRDATHDLRPLTNVRISGVFVGTDGIRAATKRSLGIQIGG